MKLIDVRLMFSCGMVVTDRATVDTATGEVYFPPRITELVRMMRVTDGLVIANVMTNNRLVPLAMQENDTATVSMPELRSAIFARSRGSIFRPTKLQRQGNARVAHLLSVAALVRAGFNVWSPRPWTEYLVFETLAFAAVGVFLAIVGVLLLRE